jgi:hypothetical protein
MLRLGGLAFGGLTLPEFLRQRARAAAHGAGQPACRAVIQIYLGGGPSHLDMYDLKPNAPAEVRGPFQPIDTVVPGIQISEHLPYQAQIADRLTIIRSGTHHVSSHSPASHLMQTGYPQAPNVDVRANSHPGAGAVVSRLLGPRTPGLPAYVAVPRPLFFGAPAYLGAGYGPFVTEGDTTAFDFQVRSLTLEGGLTLGRLTTRRSLLGEFDRFRRDLDLHGDLAGVDEFSRQAVDLVSSEAAARAFRLQDEPPEIRQRYGWTSAGQNYLLARRLVEAGVTFVTCVSGGQWDTHVDNFNILKENSLPRFDRAFAALIADLHERGLDKEVLVMAFGEFGRTPVINKDAGRDHWPGAMSILFAGGGLRMGQVIGATDSSGAAPVSSPVSPGDVLSTMYCALGIDRSVAFADPSGRTMPLLPEGKPIAELI